MTSEIYHSLLALLDKRPLVLLRFPDGIREALLHTKHGLNRFTIVRPHTELDNLQLPTLCLAELPFDGEKECYVGVITGKAAVGTFDSRLTLIRLQQLHLNSIQSMADNLTTRQFRTSFTSKLHDDSVVVGLSPKLSIQIINALAKNKKNQSAIEKAALYLPGLRSIKSVEWAQTDAIKVALQAFGLEASALPRELKLSDDTDSALEHLDASVLEDNVIGRDSTVIPGYQLIDRYVTGKAIFEKGGERLYVYTANKGPLEEMLGVDLIYVNEVAGNMVMVQYKMLKRVANRKNETADWIFRPDEQLRKEIARMKLPTIKKSLGDYRLNRTPFYFKFIKRQGTGKSHQSYIITLDHLKDILTSRASRGPKDGIRVSYRSLDGSYLGDSDLIGLIHSGYIGTHRIESEALNPIISAVSKGNRALVLAWQRSVH